jgi:hypothetical protein
MTAVIVAIALGALVASMQYRALTPAESRIANYSLVAHVAGSFVQYALQEYYYGISDAHGYIEFGAFMSRAVDVDFTRFAPEVFKVILQRPNDFPPEMGGGSTGGSATSSMAGLAAVVSYLFGDSLLVACIVVSLLAWNGQLLFYRVARETIAVNERKPALYAVMLMPSVIFWGSGFNKEAFAIAALGLLSFGLYRVAASRAFLYAPLVVIGVIGVAVTKPYILYPFAIAVGAWIYVARVSANGRDVFRPTYLAAAAAIAIGGIALTSQIFPEYSPTKVAETTAMQQGLWTTVEAGSTFEFGSADARTPLEQLPFVPFALANALFRPFVFEARNGPMLGAALETTWLMWLSFSTLRRFRLRELRGALLSSPLLVFSLVFVITFAVAVGLATSNLGSLSRYRTPMIPMYAALLLLLREKLATSRKAAREALARPAAVPITAP